MRYAFQGSIVKVFACIIIRKMHTLRLENSTKSNKLYIMHLVVYFQIKMNQSSFLLEKPYSYTRIGIRLANWMG